ncbi:protein YmiD, partial [Escherichia coli]
MQKLPLKEKCLTATANYHPGIRYIMTEYSAKY